MCRKCYANSHWTRITLNEESNYVQLGFSIQLDSIIFKGSRYGIMIRIFFNLHKDSPKKFLLKFFFIFIIDRTVDK